MSTEQGLVEGEAMRTEPRTSETHPIYVDFVPEGHTKVFGRLGMTFAPGMNTQSVHVVAGRGTSR